MEGLGRFFPVFIPWYAETKKYRLPAPTTWSPLPTTLAHARRCEEQGARWLGKSPKLSRDQLYWYEITKAYYERTDDIATFLQEYAADPDECFVFSGRSVISLETQQRIETQRRPLLGKFEVVSMAEV